MGQTPSKCAEQVGEVSARLHVLIPCKSLNLGKSRLSARLEAEGRRAFCELLLARAIRNSVGFASHRRVAVVTSDQDAAAIAYEHGVEVIEEPGQGLNAALENARCRLHERHDDLGTILVVPIDLPLASPAAFLQLLKCSGDVVIAPDENGIGTNALALRSRAAREFRFAYGDCSYIRHTSFARTSGWRITTFRHSQLAFDVDEPAHYDRWKACCRLQAKAAV